MCVITYLKWNPLRKDNQFNLEQLYNFIRSAPFSSSISKGLRGLRIGRLCASFSFHFKQASYSNEQNVKSILKNKGLSCEDQAKDRKIPPASTGGSRNIKRQTGYYHISRKSLRSNSSDSLLRASHSRTGAPICLKTRWLCLMLHQKKDQILQNKEDQQKPYPPLLLHVLIHIHIKPQSCCLTNCNLGHIYTQE